MKPQTYLIDMNREDIEYIIVLEIGGRKLAFTYAQLQAALSEAY